MEKWDERRPGGSMHQVLTPDGTVDGDVPSLSEDELRRMYRAFVLTRTYEEKKRKMQRRGEINVSSMSRGEEATPIGSFAALEEGDWCFPSYRQTAGSFYWGSPVVNSLAGGMGWESEKLAELLPDSDIPINFAPASIPVAANIPNAAGAAMEDVFEDNDTVTMAFIGDGATSEGDFHDGLNFAGVFDAPLVVICQNNQWAISVPAHRQTAAETFSRKADAHGLPRERVDGNDVFAVYEKTKEAVERARAGEGATFIETVTYRMGDHNTADEDDVYRDQEELEYWKERDPLDRFEQYLTGTGILTEADMEEIQDEVTERVQDAAEQVREFPSSDPEMMFENHLHSDGWSFSHQRAELEAELAGENPFLDHSGGGL